MKFNISELGIFSFNSYVYYLSRSFIASTRTFNLPTRDFNLAARAFSPLTRRSEAITRGFELVTREFELVSCNLCFTFPPYILLFSSKSFVGIKFYVYLNIFFGKTFF